MKKLTIVLITLLFFTVNPSLKAQNKDSLNSKTSEYATVFQNNKEKPSVSGFGAINMDFGSIKDNIGFNTGLDLAVLMNKSFYFGLYGRALLSFPEYDFEYYNSDTNTNLSANTHGFFTHGGIIIGGIFYPNKPIHFGLSTKIGGGAFGMVNTNDKYHYEKNNNYKDSWIMGPVMVITPQLDVEMNINYWFKLRLGVGYQWVSNSSLDYQYMDANGSIIDKKLISSSDLSSPYISLGLVFGWFK